MRLTDRVEIITQTPATWKDGYQVPGQTVSLGMFPANLNYAVVQTSTEPNRNALIEELRAIIAPMDFDAAVMKIVWLGKTYTPDGPPMVRRRNGATHHLTIPLRLVEG